MSKCKVYFLKTKSRRNWELALEFREHCSISAVSESTFDFFDSKNVDFMSLENIFWTVSSFVKICHVKKVVKIGFFLYAIKYITKRCLERNSFYVLFKFCLYVQFVEMSVSKAGRKTVEFGILISFINYCVCVFFFIHQIIIYFVRLSISSFLFKFAKFQNKFRSSANIDYLYAYKSSRIFCSFCLFVCLSSKHTDYATEYTHFADIFNDTTNLII